MAASPRAEVPRLVVGAALYDRRGRVLAAQRHGGGWEFPGGKVEAGESQRAALVRECAEELGVPVRLWRRLPGVQPCGAGRVLRVFAGHVVAGRPEPLCHARLRWLRPGELAGLAWLPADEPFLPAVLAASATARRRSAAR